MKRPPSGKPSGFREVGVVTIGLFIDGVEAFKGVEAFEGVDAFEGLGRHSRVFGNHLKPISFRTELPPINERRIVFRLGAKFTRVNFSYAPAATSIDRLDNQPAAPPAMSNDHLGKASTASPLPVIVNRSKQ